MRTSLIALAIAASLITAAEAAPMTPRFLASDAAVQQADYYCGPECRARHRYWAHRRWERERWRERERGYNYGYSSRYPHYYHR